MIGNEGNAVKNRRLILEDFAKVRGFDPLLPENWYSKSLANIDTVKVDFVLLFKSC